MKQCKRVLSASLACGFVFSAAAVYAQETIQVSGWHQLFDFSKDAVLLAESKFEEANDGIDLQLVDTAFDQALQQATVTTLANNPADVIQLVAGWVPAMADIGGLANIAGLLTEDEVNSIPLTLRESLTIDGELMAVPWNPGQILVHYNRNLLEEAGLDPDSPPKTWAEMKEMALAVCELPDRDAGPVFGVALRTAQNPNSAQWSIPIIYGHGGDVVVDGEISVNNDGVAQAMNWITEIIQANCSPAGFSFGESRNLFAQGRAAFIFEGPWGRGLIENLSGGELTVGADADVWVAQMPAAPDGSVRTIGNPIVLTVSSKSEKPELAAEFLRTVLFDEEVTTSFFQSSGLLPSSSDAILRSGPVGADPYAQAFVETLPVTFDTPIKDSKFNAVLSELAVGMQEIIAGADTEATLDNVQSRVERLMSR